MWRGDFLAISGKDLDFKVLKEDWNVYGSSDGSIIKVRFVLLKVIKTTEYGPDGEPVYGFASQNIIACKSPKNLMGRPTTPPPTQERLASEEMTEVAFTSKTENWNEYLVEDGTRLRIKLVVAKIKRTKFFDPMGYPVYNVVASTVTSVTAPNSLKKPPLRTTRKTT